MAIKDLFKKAKYISVPTAKQAATETDDVFENNQDYMTCAKCEKTIYAEQYARLLKVCPLCEARHWPPIKF